MDVIRTSDMNDVIERKEMADKIAVAEKMVKELHRKNTALKELMDPGKERAATSTELKQRQTELSELQKKSNAAKTEIDSVAKETSEMEAQLRAYDECMKEVIDDSKFFYCLCEETK
jgi:hypothetical protein